jgi:hypothetical protein
VNRNSILILAVISILIGFLGTFALDVGTFASREIGMRDNVVRLYVMFNDPVYRGAAVAESIIGSLVAFPIVFWGMRGKKLRTAAPLAMIAPALCIGVITPYLGEVSILISMAVLVTLAVYTHQRTTWNLPAQANAPNQSPDPALASGTSSARQKPRHR